MPDRKLDRLTQPPRAGGAPDSLVVLLHGLGSNSADLMGLAPHLCDALPRTLFVSPDAPEPCDMAPMGFQWFSLQDRNPLVMARGIAVAAPILDAFLDELLAEYKLAPDRLALVGFSQGTMMALHVGLRRAVAPAAIVGYSGMLVVPENVAPEQFAAAITSRPPVLLVHGDSDDLIPVQALFAAAQGLATLGIPAEWHISPGVGHGIDQEGLRQGGEFLARFLKR